MSTRLEASTQALTTRIRAGDLDPILEILAERRTLDLSDLCPADQADLIARRTATLLPPVGRLAALLDDGRQLTVKFGIDPTAADVHLGHAVPMILASRFQRMGHRVVFIVGDLTASIGDPSGRSADRPALSDDDVARNLATYRAQFTPFLDFERADFRFNREWLGRITLPEFLATLARLPVSAALQRDDFRNRLDDGAGLSMAELVYSVVMALDSVEVRADIELGGLDQLLNMQMCRRVMENAGQTPEIVVATPVIEGTDGSGVKMSKSRGNYIGLALAANEVVGKLMSIPDRLVPGFLAALTELLDPEIELLAAQHPMAVKTLLAADVTATIHGLDAARAARASFAAQFSRRRFADIADLPVVDGTATTSVADVFVRVTGLVSSLNQVRRVAAGGGLRLVHEADDGEQVTTRLSETEASMPIVELPPGAGRTYLRCGRFVVEVVRDTPRQADSGHGRG